MSCIHAISGDKNINIQKYVNIKSQGKFIHIDFEKVMDLKSKDN